MSIVDTQDFDLEPAETAEAPEADAEDTADDAEEQLEAQDAEGEDDTDDEPQDEEGDEEGEDGDVDGPADGFTRIEYEGEAFDVPEKLKDAFLRQSDYTKKTQALADERKQHDEHVSDVRRYYELRDTQFEQAVELKGIDKQLEQFDQVDWDRLIAEEPQTAQQLQYQRQQLKEARDTLNNTLTQTIHQVQQEQVQAATKAAAATRAKLSEKHSYWSPDLEEEMAQYAIKKGIPERQLRTAVDFGTLDILYDAYQYDKIRRARQAKQNGKGKRPAPAAQQEAPKPARQVQGRRTRNNTGLNDKLSTEEWVRRRNKQLADRASL